VSISCFCILDSEISLKNSTKSLRFYWSNLKCSNEDFFNIVLYNGGTYEIKKEVLTEEKTDIKSNFNSDTKNDVSTIKMENKNTLDSTAKNAKKIYSPSMKCKKMMITHGVKPGVDWGTLNKEKQKYVSSRNSYIYIFVYMYL
jgi:hypothetical protein